MGQYTRQQRRCVLEIKALAERFIALETLDWQKDVVSLAVANAEIHKAPDEPLEEAVAKEIAEIGPSIALQKAMAGKDLTIKMCGHELDLDVEDMIRETVATVLHLFESRPCEVHVMA